MRASDIEARAVAKIVLVALFWAALAVLLAIAILHTRTTLRWVVTAIFLALALDPAVGLIEKIKVSGRSVPQGGRGPGRPRRSSWRGSPSWSCT